MQSEEEYKAQCERVIRWKMMSPDEVLEDLTDEERTLDAHIEIASLLAELSWVLYLVTGEDRFRTQMVEMVEMVKQVRPIFNEDTYIDAMTMSERMVRDMRRDFEFIISSETRTMLKGFAELIADLQ